MRDIVQRWTAALRSGKYKQGRGRLRRVNNCYCCLGVLCEIAGLPAVLTDSGFEYDHCDMLPPMHLAVKYRFADSAFTVLANMNDQGGEERNGATFNQIADYIEQNEDTLFKG